MKRKRNSPFFALYFVFIFCIFSCSSNDRPIERGRFQMVEKGIMKFPLDSVSKNTCYASQTIIDENGNEWLYALNPLAQEIPIYNLATGALNRVMKLKENGPDGVGKLQYATIISPDSILIVATGRLTFYLINAKGKKIETYTLMTGERNNKKWVQLGTQYPFLYKERFYYAFNPDVDYQKSKYDLHSNIFAYTVTHDSVALIPEIKYPEFLANTSNNELFWYESFFPSYLINKNLLVYTIPALDSIFTFNLETRKVKKFPGVSKLNKAKTRAMKVNENPFQYLDQAFLAKYLVYDKYKKLYYRINLLPMEPRKSHPKDGTHLLAKPISIQIFDSAFNCIGETLLPRDRLKSIDYFIGTKGLYISNNNPENPDYNEDSLNYTIYVPEIIK